MSNRKFLHINNVLFVMLLAGNVCHGAHVVQRGAASDIKPYEPTRWERFTQHPVASYIPSALAGGVGASLFAHGTSSDSNWYKMASLVPLTAASLLATYVQSVQRAAERPLGENENPLNEVKPRTSRWWFAPSALGAAALAASLGAYYNNNSLLLGLWRAVKLAAIPTVCAAGAAGYELFNDLKHADAIINWASGPNFKEDTNTESIRWALEALNDSASRAIGVQKNYIDFQRETLKVSGADNLLKIQATLLKDPKPDDAPKIQLLKDMAKNEPDIWNNLQFARDAVDRILSDLSFGDMPNVNNYKYEKAEGALLALQQKDAQQPLIDLFKQYFNQTNALLDKYKERAELYRDAKMDAAELEKRERVAQFMQEAHKKARAQTIIKDAFQSKFESIVIKKVLEDLLGVPVTWSEILENLTDLRAELTNNDTEKDKIVQFNKLATEIFRKSAL